MTSDEPRQIIVVDLETGGLEPEAPILEVAAVNLQTGEELYFVPSLRSDWLQFCEYDALRINRYFERGVYKHELTPSATSNCYEKLESMLRRQTLAGSNPTFDAAFLAHKISDVWHHRLLDLSAYAAGKLGIPPNELPGMQAVCERLGVVNEEEHSALGDARATAECFRKLMEM